MPTLTASDVLDASDFVAGELNRSKRASLIALAQLWSTIDPADIQRTVALISPMLVQLMQAQQLFGRRVGWLQAQLAIAMALGIEPGTATLPVGLVDVSGTMRSGAPFEAVVQPTAPGMLARISGGMTATESIAAGASIMAGMLGSIAHDEARATAQACLTSNRGDARVLRGYARRAEGASTCDFCRMLATRGPVYTQDTAGFRAHGFCDCTVYVVPRGSFRATDDDLEAYGRWKNVARARKPSTSTIDVSLQGRLATIENQIAALEVEPVPAWAARRLETLYGYRADILAQM